MNLKENYIKIRQWFQPYYKPRPDGYVEPELDEVNSEDKQAEEFKSVNGDKALKVKVLTNKNPLTQVVNSKHKPTSGNIIYFYHDDKILQVFARFEQGQGFAHQERDNAARKELDPLIYPTDRQYDRAHLIPIGYHALKTITVCSSAGTAIKTRKSSTTLKLKSSSSIKSTQSIG